MQEGSVETIEAMVSHIVHTLDNNGYLVTFGSSCSSSHFYDELFNCRINFNVLIMIGIWLFVIRVDNDPMPPRPFPQVNLGGFLASGKTLGRDVHQSGGTGEWWSEDLGLTGDGDAAVLVLAPVHLH